MSWPVTFDTKPKIPAAVEIFFQLDLIDLPTRLRLVPRLRLVTVLALVVRLRLRLSNEYYNINLNLYVKKSLKISLFYYF